MKKNFGEYYLVEKNIPEIKMYEAPIDGVELLNEIRETIQGYIIADEEVITAATLWCVYTWYMDEVYYAPIAYITSPERECGKSKLLNILKELSCKPQLINDITKAALFRTISDYKGTLLFDHLENSFLNRRDIENIFINGFIKNNSLIVRCTGEQNNPHPYETWGAKAICSTRKMSKQLSSVSIRLPLKRKLRSEIIKDVVSSNPEIWHKLVRKIARFVNDTKDQVKTIEVPKLEELSDKANDCWQSLFRVTLVAGGQWLDMAKKAAILLSNRDKGTESYKIELLKAIENIFITYQEPKIGSKTLCDLLNNQKQVNLKVWNQGKDLTPRNLAHELKDFGITPKNIRIGSENKKGYDFTEFEEAFQRY